MRKVDDGEKKRKKRRKKKNVVFSGHYVIAIHFLLGELPIEGRNHRDMFSLFYRVWCNPQTKIYQIVKCLLTNSSNNSRTWAINLRHLAKMYNIEDPLLSIQKQTPTKANYKELIITRITSFHKKELKIKADNNSNMKYMNDLI